MKKVKAKKQFGKKELIFNIVSIIIILVVAIYFGIRSFYYYSKETYTKKVTSSTLYGVIINNNKITKTTGLHEDKDGYYFNGNVSNNYVKFANRLFRIIRVNSNNTIKLISDSNVATFIYGEDSDYENSNVYNWLNKTTTSYSGTYYNGLPNAAKYLAKTIYSIDTLKDNKIVKSKKVFKDYISILNINDYILAGGKNSYLNNGKYSWIIGLDNDKNILYIDNDGNVETATNYESYGITPVITLQKKVKISGGSGTLNDPYIVSMNNDKNYIDSYVKLGSDIWKVYSDDNKTLKLSLNGYINVKNVEYQSIYSKTNSLYDPLSKNNIAYYLNRTYYNSLSYKNILSECSFAIGEISTDAGLNMTNIYTDTISNKVGLPNIFDYNTNTNLNNYFYLNTTSSVGSMVYVYNNLGTLDEAKATEKKHIVPTICLDNSLIKSGQGSLDNPYAVE